MGLIGKTADVFLTYKFIRVLTKPFRKTKAYKMKLIDRKGKYLKKRKDMTKREKEAVPIFNRMVWNLKKLLGKLPLGRSTIASYAAALWLLHEHTDFEMVSEIDGRFIEFLVEERYIEDTNLLNEERQMVTEETKRKLETRSECLITEDIYLDERIVLEEGDKVIIDPNDSRGYDFLGVPVYAVKIEEGWVPITPNQFKMLTELPAVTAGAPINSIGQSLDGTGTIGVYDMPLGTASNTNANAHSILSRTDEEVKFSIKDMTKEEIESKIKNLGGKVGTFAGKKVFQISSKQFNSCLKGKKPPYQYRKYVGEDEIGQAIRAYGRKFPHETILVQNEATGDMVYFKMGRGKTSLDK